jgi:hypothetical protein
MLLTDDTCFAEQLRSLGVPFTRRTMSSSRRAASMTSSDVSPEAAIAASFSVVTLFGVPVCARQFCVPCYRRLAVTGELE